MGRLLKEDKIAIFENFAAGLETLFFLFRKPETIESNCLNLWQKKIISFIFTVLVSLFLTSFSRHYLKL